ncbi:MAG: LLM class flavin-dependent oxidoreductase [Proteobacteria bacterium]|nr:MAG: LLM class flavin-dependent oxidoreductase [Pseudomonadota bacterium]
MFSMRFDLRAPAHGAPAADLYAAALDMCAWGEQHGCVAVQVSEHHASPDGYLPAPLVLASAIAGRTRRLPIQVAALILPLHDPVELAEQMSVLDLVSGGRVSYVVAVGYRAEEYAAYGRDFAARGRRMDACVEALQRAFTGEPFEFEGRRVQVLPRPRTPGGPLLLVGGGSAAAVRRAARFGLGMLTQGGDARLAALYRAECERRATKPGLFLDPPADTVTSAFVAEDPDAAWEQIGPYLLHDARMYAAWMGDATAASPVSRSGARTLAELRAARGPYRIFTPDEAIAHVRARGPLLLQPLCGGLPPALAWEHLETLARRVLPALRDGA